MEFLKTLVTRYNLPNYKVSSQFKSYEGVFMYPPLWTNYLVAVYDDIENRSICSMQHVQVVMTLSLQLAIDDYAQDGQQREV